ncbi:MAG: hypothetical protein EXS51_00615 [Candidatus Taylorbacteria bacterium]|nr:hypothetical protein [Candidatus Taylorbacteria bacterium]
MRTPTIYIPDTHGVPEGLLVSLVFWPNYRFDIPEKRLFLRDIMKAYETPFFTIVSSVREADFVAVPFEYFFAVDSAPLYLERAYALAKEAGKKVLLFDYTDYVDRNPKLPPHAVLFRVSAYRHHKRKNEIVMPYFVEDFGSVYGIASKRRGTTLLVGYCGQTRFESPVKRLRATLKRGLVCLQLYLSLDTYPQAHIRGIFWRQTALRALRKGGVTLRVIERSFYSLFNKERMFEPKQNRLEYVENLRECDLALSVRGDANASQRFYEALSASRVPLFLDTDCVLPLEEIIPYDEFILRVTARDSMALCERVRVWEREQSSAEFDEKERRAREVFLSQLRLDRYFEIVFDREKSPYKEVLFR